jgi:hypothetical protein
MEFVEITLSTMILFNYQGKMKRLIEKIVKKVVRNIEIKV